jgi:outer membrane lipoprotein-sorting protein
MGAAVRRGIFVFISALAAVLALGVDVVWAQSGLDIMKKQRELLRTKDEEEYQVQKLINKAGAVKERKVVRYNLGVEGDLNKILLRFTAPRDVENTGLLTWEAKDGDDTQWLYLPATGKPKRIASGGKKNKFMGTDFTFEDLRPENLKAHKYELKGSEAVDGQDCYVVEALPATDKDLTDSSYSKRKLWIRKDNYYTVKKEYYDKNNQLLKVETHRKLVNVKGSVWRADEIEMADVQGGTKTLTLIEKRAIDKGLKDSLFTESELTRGGS